MNFEGLLREGMVPPANQVVLPYRYHPNLSDFEGAAVALYLRVNSQRSTPTPTMVVVDRHTIVAFPDGEEFFPVLKDILAEDVLKTFPTLRWGSWEKRTEYAFIQTLGLLPLGKNGLATLDPTADEPPVVHTPPPSPSVDSLPLTSKIPLPTKRRFIDCVKRQGAYWGYEILSPTEYVIFYGAAGAKPREVKKSFQSTAQMVSDITKRVMDKVDRGTYVPY